MLIAWVRLFHTLVFVVMVGAILFLLYGGLANQLTRWTALAFALISIEVVIYAAHGCRCPLRTWTENLTPPRQVVRDIQSQAHNIPNQRRQITSNSASAALVRPLRWGCCTASRLIALTSTNFR